MFTNYSEFTEDCLAFGFSSCLAIAKKPAKTNAVNKFGLLLLIDLCSMKSAIKMSAKFCSKCCCVFAIYLLNKLYLIRNSRVMFTNYSEFTEDCFAFGTSSCPASGYPSESRPPQAIAI